MRSDILSEGPGGEELGDEVEGASINVDPRGVEPDDGVVAEGGEEVDLWVETLQIFRRPKHFVELHLVPRHFHSDHLVYRLVHRLHRPFSQHFFQLNKIQIHVTHT